MSRGSFRHRASREAGGPTHLGAAAACGKACGMLAITAIVATHQPTGRPCAYPGWRRRTPPDGTRRAQRPRGAQTGPRGGTRGRRPRRGPGRPWGQKLGGDGRRRLPGPGDGPQEGAVAGPGVAGPGRADSGPPSRGADSGGGGARVPGGRVLLHHDGFVAVLDEVADAVMPPFEGIPQGGMRRLRMLRGNGRWPVRTRRWAWLGRRA
jgi:hypothetical protein